MQKLYDSPIQRLIDAGKTKPVPAEEERLTEHMRQHYVPVAVSAQRRNRTVAERIKNVVLFTSIKHT
jgi:hypothetical protein